MKKILLILMLTLLVHSAELVQEVEEGDYRICIYDNGETLTIPWGDFCPYTIQILFKKKLRLTRHFTEFNFRNMPLL